MGIVVAWVSCLVCFVDVDVGAAVAADCYGGDCYLFVFFFNSRTTSTLHHIRIWASCIVCTLAVNPSNGRDHKTTAAARTPSHKISQNNNNSRDRAQCLAHNIESISILFSYKFDIQYNVFGHVASRMHALKIKFNKST